MATEESSKTKAASACTTKLSGMLRMDRESQSVPEFMAITTYISNHCTQFSQLRRMPLLSTHITTSLQSQDDNTIYRRAARNLCWEKLPMVSKICERELTCIIWRLDMSPKLTTRARPETSRRRKKHWREYAQVDVRYLHREAVSRNCHNRLPVAPSSGRCRQEYWRLVKAPTVWQSKKCQPEIAVRAKTRRIVVRTQVCTKLPNKSRPGSCWLLISTRWTWWHCKHDYRT